MPSCGLHHMKSVKKSNESQLQEGGGLWLTNCPILCQVFKLVGTVAAHAGILAVFALVPHCQQYPGPNPAPSLLSQRCHTPGWLSSPLLLARMGFPGWDTAGLAQTSHHPSGACPASVLLRCQGTQIYLPTSMCLKRLLWLSSCCSQPQPALA